MRKNGWLVFFIITFFSHASEPLLFYCGVTMVPAMQKIAVLYTQRYGQDITIVQGGSGEIFKILTINQNGDLYLPGNPLYITETQIPELFPYRQTIGNISLTLFTRPGNPLHIHGLHDLLRGDIRIGIGSPGIGSIGKTTQKTLYQYGGEPFVRRVGINALHFAVDSRDMNHLFSTNQIDVGLTWKPALQPLTVRGAVTQIPLSPKVAPPILLVLSTVRYSQQPMAAKKFIDLAVSQQGKRILIEAGIDVQ